MQRPEEPLSGSEKAGFQSWRHQTCRAGYAKQVSCFLGLLYGPGACLLPAGYSGPVASNLGHRHRPVFSQFCKHTPSFQSPEYILGFVTQPGSPLPAMHTWTGLSPQDLASKVHLSPKGGLINSAHCLCLHTLRNWPQGPNHPNQTGLASPGRP